VAELVYSGLTSLDGYVADEEGGFLWAAPDEEVHAHVNELERPVGTYLYGRRLYEVMRYWETLEPGGDVSDVEVDYAELWRATDKVVYSRTLDAVDTGRTRLERDFDPGAVRSMVDAADRDVTVGGPTLAATALHAGIVDVVHQYLNPVVVGGGTPFLPPGLRTGLELVDSHVFGSGVVHLHYRVARPDAG
jgi:dihydrofolate reductase